MLASLQNLYRRIFSRPAVRPQAGAGASAALEDFEELNRQAPLRHTSTASTSTLLCRDPLLGRDQRIAGYRFTLRESTRNRIRLSSRSIHHVYAEVLVNNLLEANVLRLLEHRLAVIEVPDSFLWHPSLRRFPSANTIFTLERTDDRSLQHQQELVQQIAVLRQLGYRIGMHASTLEEIPAELMPLLSMVLTSGARSDPGDLRRLLACLHRQAPHAEIAAIDLDTTEEFQFLHGLGARYFHGPFVTRREEWKTADIAPEVLKARPLIEALRSDGPLAEVVAQAKRNPLIVLRLLRYANSAAFHRGTEVSSIEHAIQLVGRTQLLRWLMLVLLGGHAGDGRSHAALESAMVRGRTLELLAPQAEGSNLFLVGLLSLADVIFQAEMASALDSLGVSEDIRAAILSGSGPYGAMLALAMAWESGEIERIEECAQRCQLGLESTAEAYMQALWWALEVPS